MPGFSSAPPRYLPSKEKGACRKLEDCSVNQQYGCGTFFQVCDTLFFLSPYRSTFPKTKTMFANFANSNYIKIKGQSHNLEKFPKHHTKPQERGHTPLSERLCAPLLGEPLTFQGLGFGVLWCFAGARRRKRHRTAAPPAPHKPILDQHQPATSPPPRRSSPQTTKQQSNIIYKESKES